MRSYLLCDFQPSTILEVGSDASGSEGVAADLGLDPSRKRTSADHMPDVGLE